MRKTVNTNEIVVFSHFHSSVERVARSHPDVRKRKQKTDLKCFTLKYRFFDDQRRLCGVPNTPIVLKPLISLDVRFCPSDKNDCSVDIEFSAILLAIFAIGNLCTTLVFVSMQWGRLQKSNKLTKHL